MEMSKISPNAMGITTAFMITKICVAYLSSIEKNPKTFKNWEPPPKTKPRRRLVRSCAIWVQR